MNYAEHGNAPLVTLILVNAIKQLPGHAAGFPGHGWISPSSVTFQVLEIELWFFERSPY